MGKHRSQKQSSAATSVQSLRSVIAKTLTETWTQETHTHLKAWLIKYLPSAGLTTTGTTAWKEIRDSICNDAKLMEKLVCVFQDCRDSGTILLLTQLFGELMSSKRTSKMLVQSGLTLAVLCQIRVCCCMASNSNPASQSNATVNWQSAMSSDATNMPFSASLSMQCSILGSSPSDVVTEKQSSSNATSASNTSNTSNTLQCSPQVAVALHQLACRVFPIDSRYNAKARATGAILGTLLAAKSLFLDRKSLMVLLCCLRFYVNSGKNLKLLGAHGCLNLVHRLMGSLLPRQTRLLKLTVELLALLLKSSSNCSRFVQSGGVTTLLATFENIHRTDTRFRQLQVRRLILRCILLATSIRAGRAAVLQCGTVQTLYQISRELPPRQELDTIFLTALGVIKNSAGPRRLPVNSLQSPYSFDSTLSGEMPSRANTSMHLKVPRRTAATENEAITMGRSTSPSQGSTASGPQTLHRRASTEDESPDTSDDDNEFNEETIFSAVKAAQHRQSLMRRDSTEDANDGGCATGADDSDSDCGTGNASGSLVTSNDPTAAPPPLESDPVVLSSYDMFFKELCDLPLTNTALLAMPSQESSAATEVINNVANGNNPLENDFVTQVGIRVNNAQSNNNSSGNSSGVASATTTAPLTPSQRRAIGCRKPTGKVLLSRRTSELTVSETSSAGSLGYVTNSLTITSFGESGGRVPPLTLIGEAAPTAERNNDRDKSASSGHQIGGFGSRDSVRYAKLCNANRRLAMWNKIPYPCMFGWVPPNSTEPQISVPALSIRRLVMADCERFLNKSAPDMVNEVIYDLDSLILAHRDILCRSNSTLNPGTAHSPMAHPIVTNNDLERIGRPVPKVGSSVMFNSQFECGNLRRAIRIREFEYDLILTPDVSTNHHLQWFYFEVYNTPALQPIRFNILNCEKPKSQYEKGMQVLAFSVTEAALGRPCWRRVGWDIAYYKNYLQHPSGPLPAVSYYTMTFTLQFDHSFDVVYLAYHYPYSYTSLLYELENIQNRVLPPDCYYTCQTMCTSEMNNNVPLITITSTQNNVNSSSSSATLPGISQSSSFSSMPAMLASLSSPTSHGAPAYRSPQQQQQRPYVILTSRVHPGETNSSWMMRGLIAFLLSDTQSARRARQTFIFKIVPMLNVDGVLNGNHRCSLYGDDLNRSWTKPSVITAPTIFHTKRLMAWLRLRRRPILCFVDFHGHSRKKNVFVLGCSPNQSWRRRDIANPAVDVVTGEEDTRWRLLPVLLAATSPAFSLQDCCFMIERAKEPTGRVVCWRQVGLIATYTLEATFCGFDQGSYRGIQVTPVHLQEIGADLSRCFEPLLAYMGRCPIPNARYGDNLAPPQTGAGASTGSFPSSPAIRAAGLMLNCDMSSSSSSSSSSGDSVRDENSDDEADDAISARRSTVVTTKTSFITKKR